MSKILKLAIGIALTSSVMWSCKNNTEPEVKTVEVEQSATKHEIAANAKLAKAEFTIEGMTCAIGCAKAIEKKLSNMEGVKSAKVDFDKKLAMVEYDEAIVNPASLEKTVTTVGDTYSVNSMKTVEAFSTDGAKKSSCAGKDKKECKGKSKAECKTKCDEKKSSCKEKGKKECKGKSEKKA